MINYMLGKNQQKWLWNTQHISENHTVQYTKFFVPCMTFVRHAMCTVCPGHVLRCHHSWLNPPPHQFYSSFFSCVWSTSIWLLSLKFIDPLWSSLSSNMWAWRTSHSLILNPTCWLMSFWMVIDVVSSENYRYWWRSKLHAMPRSHWN
jgi:hypothetical protein